MKTLFLDIETVPTETALAERLSADPEQDIQEKVIKRLSLAARTARIFCMAFAMEPPVGSSVETVQGEENEILRRFWSLAKDTEIFVGHNILDFDLRFIYQRSIVNRVKPSRDIPFSRFRKFPVFDTMHEWSKWGRELISLDDLAKCLGIPSPKENLNGSMVYDYYKAGREAEIVNYCRCDVETVREIYRRLTFSEAANDSEGFKD